MLSGTKLAGGSPDRGRVENDFYATNPKAVEMLLADDKFRQWFWKDYHSGNVQFLEPCVGQGHIIQGVKNYYNNKNLPIDFTCLDIADRGYNNVIVQDFMQYDTDKRFDCIMTNPPYEIAMEFAQKGMELLKPNGKMCMFLKIQFLEGRKRREFFDEYPPVTFMYLKNGWVLGETAKNLSKQRTARKSDLQQQCATLGFVGKRGLQENRL